MNKAFNSLPPFVWGEAADEAGLHPDEFLIHNRHPRFECRVISDDYDDADYDGMPPISPGLVAEDPETGKRVYGNSVGLIFTDFVFIGGVPDVDALAKACDAATANYVIFNLEATRHDLDDDY